MTLLPCVPEQAKITNYHLNKKSISSSYQGTDYEAYEQQTMDYTMAADIHRSTLKSSMTQSSVAHHTMKRNLSTDDSNSGNVSSEEGAEKKRLRVENIVTSICQPRSPKSHDLNTNSSEQQRNKRKQFVPQQHGSVTSGDPATGGDSGCNVGDIDVVTEDEPNTKSHLSSPPPLKQENTAEPKPESSSEEKMENTLLKNQIKIMSEQLQKNQQLNQELSEKISRDRYELARLTLHQPQIEMEAYIRAIRSEVNQTVKLAVREALEKHSNTTSAPLTPTTLSAAHSSSANQAFNNNNNNNREKNSSSSNPMTIREVSVAQRGSLSSSITNSTTATAALKNSIADQIKRSSSTIPSVPSPHIAHQGGVMTNPPHPALSNPLLPLAALPYYGQTLPSPFLTPNQLTSAAAAAQFNSNTMSAQLLQAAMEEELLQSHLRERDSQNKKKRTKVTDTRLSPRTASKPALDHHSNPTGIKPEFNLDPTAAASKAAFEAFGPSSALFHAGMSQMQSVFMNGFCGQPADLLRGGNRSPTNLSENSDRGPSSPELGAMSMHPALPGQNVTLTPLHLRKAKLMFFYVRYPSSVLLKNFFCDVHFNKNNTAQLVKWFSNFREFYYIQMEKYARQSIAEGMSPEQVEITPDSELYKILNLHYNRNNQIEVPRSFLETIQTTLREFIKAITCSKDREQSWKKPIYKIIARLDDSVPEYFKSQDWMEQLSD